MKKKRILLITFLAFCFVMMLATTSFASDNVKQSGIYKDKIVITFTPPEMTSQYYTLLEYSVWLNTDNAGWVRKQTLPATATSAEIKGLSAKHRYDVQLKYSYRYKTDYTDTTYTDSYVGSLYDLKLIPAKVTGLKQERWYHYIKQIDTKWNKQQSITGYHYQLLNSKGKVIRGSTNTSATNVYANFAKISNNATYTTRVRGYTVFNGKKIYGPWSDKVYLIGQTPNIKVKASKKKLKVSWGKVTGATSYTVMMSTSRDKGYKAVKTVSASKARKATIKKLAGKKLKKGKTYYIYIRTNKKVGKKTYRSNSKDGMLYLTSVKCK